MTHRQYTENNAISQRTAAYRFGQCGVGGYSADTELTPDQLDALNTRFGEIATQNRLRKVAQRSVSVPVTVAQIEPQQKAQYLPQIVAQKAQTETQTEPKKVKRNIEKEILFWSSFAITAISILLTNSGLFVFADGFGILAGVMFGFSLVSAVVVARNSDKQETSEKALDVVLYLEIGACFLHVFTFHYAFESKITLSDGWLLWIPSIVLSVCVAVMSYKGVELVRNYNVE
jgi:hypothetical protein